MKKVLHLLNELYYHRRSTVFPTNDPTTLAYNLRQALAAAEHHADYSHLSPLRLIYTFQVKPGRVRAEYNPDAAIPPPDKVGIPDVDREVPLATDRPRPTLPDLPDPPPSAAVATPTLHLPEVEDLHGVVGAALRFARSHTELYFPSVVLEDEARRKLHAWSVAQSPPWGFIDHEDAGITLTREAVDPELLWSPDEPGQ